MKKIATMIMLGIAVAAISATPPLAWKSVNIEVGEVRLNVAKEVNFSFTNNGTMDTQILEAKGSCGCTVVDFPRTSIAPGSSATIKATFQSSKTGVFRKNITVKTTDSEKEIMLYFSGSVVE